MGGIAEIAAVRIYSIPRSNLQFKVTSKYSESSMGPVLVLSEDKEQVVVKWITCQKGYPWRNPDVQLSVKEFLTVSNRKTPFSQR